MTVSSGLGLVVAAYLLGSVSFSYLIVKLKEGKVECRSGVRG